jgi:hypothetical protein
MPVCSNNPVPNVQWKTPDGGQRTWPKHVEFLDKIHFGKLVRRLVFLKRKKIMELCELC